MTIEVPVYCIPTWQDKPFLDYFIEINEWLLILNSKRDFKRIKHIMNVAKKRIQSEVVYDIKVVPTIKFIIQEYKEEKR